jgi:hypothetical protein
MREVASKGDGSLVKQAGRPVASHEQYCLNLLLLSFSPDSKQRLGDLP